MNEYISGIEDLIRSCFLMAAYQLNIDRRTQDIAYISGRVDFIDGSSLDFKEFIENTDKGIEKYKYGYNFRNGAALIFRYDNAHDPRAKDLNSFPDHKHTEEGNIIESHSTEHCELCEEIRIVSSWEF